MTEGFLKGAIDAEGFTDIEKCVSDVEEAITDIEIVYKDFKTSNVESIVDALRHVSDFIQVVKSGMSDCSSMKADWAKLAKMAEIFKSPTSFAWAVGTHLMLNGVEIYHEIQTAVIDYETAKYFDFGL